MRNEDGIFLVLLFVLFFVGCLTGGAVSNVSKEDSWQKDAVAAGHAEFYLDDNHERQWRWKECK